MLESKLACKHDIDPASWRIDRIEGRELEGVPSKTCDFQIVANSASHKNSEAGRGSVYYDGASQLIITSYWDLIQKLYRYSAMPYFVARAMTNFECPSRKEFRVLTNACLGRFRVTYSADSNSDHAH